MSRNQIYEQIKQVIADFIDDYALEYPLDVYGLAKDINISLKEYNTLSKFIRLSSDGFSFLENDKYYIYVNEDMPEVRKRFTIAHEIGHFVLNNFFKKFMVDNEEQEKYANFFARYLLAPLPLVFLLENKSTKSISKAFGVSNEVAENVIGHCQKWLQYGSLEWTNYEKQILESQIRPHNVLTNETKYGWVNPELVAGVKYTPQDEYPIIEPYITSDKMPDKIIPFSKVKEVRDRIEEYFICFYVDDREFEKVLRNPRRYLNLFANSDGLIGFDFSVHDDMPKIEQQHQMFLNQALLSYYGNMGIPVIPNIRYGDIDNIGDYLKSIPRNIFVAIGTHGQIQTNKQKGQWIKCLELIVEELEPEGIIVYGPHPNDVFKRFEDMGIVFKYFDPWRPPLHHRK